MSFRGQHQTGYSGSSTAICGPLVLITAARLQPTLVLLWALFSEATMDASPMKHWARYGLLLSLLVAPALGWCQKTTVTGRIDLTRIDSTKDKAGSAIADKSNIVVWLTPVDNSSGKNTVPAPVAPQRAQLLQKDKSFKPHILVIPMGTVV